MMKKIFASILLIALFVTCLSSTAFAAAANVDFDSATRVNGIQPKWVYQYYAERQWIMGSKDSVPSSWYYREMSGYYHPNGTPVNAQGTLYPVSTSYGFPSANLKTVTYGGLLTAYINGT